MSSAVLLPKGALIAKSRHQITTDSTHPHDTPIMKPQMKSEASILVFVNDSRIRENRPPVSANEITIKTMIIPTKNNISAQIFFLRIRNLREISTYSSSVDSLDRNQEVTLSKNHADITLAS